MTGTKGKALGATVRETGSAWPRLAIAKSIWLWPVGPAGKNVHERLPCGPHGYQVVGPNYILHSGGVPCMPCPTLESATSN